MTSVPREPPPISLPDRDTAGDGLPEAGDGAVELASGILFASIGLVGLTIARGYPSGTTLNMGSGYVPQVVAAALVGLGLIGVVRGLLVGGWRLPRIALRPLVCIPGAIIVFALTIDRFGLFIATFAAALLGAAAQAPFAWRQAPVIALALAAFCALLFGYGLKLSIPVWPR